MHKWNVFKHVALNSWDALLYSDVPILGFPCENSKYAKLSYFLFIMKM